ncbi:MAG: hypothetical protein JWN02_560, partial [Acidobacteria bacterium]|nr:hypothetical protein [Acidobacteriota bacterium]
FVPSSSPLCATVNYFEQEAGPGDGTVPLLSAFRTDSSNTPSPCDLQALGAPDFQRHDSLNINYSVVGRILKLLKTPINQTPDCASMAASVISLSHRREATESENDGTQYLLELISAQVDRVSDDLGHQQRFDVTDDQTDPGSVPGLSVDGISPDSAFMTFAPGATYTIDFTVTKAVLAELLRVVGSAPPSEATRYFDLPLVVGRNAKMVIDLDGHPHLFADNNNDGVPETEVAPSAHVTGSNSVDVTPPTLALTESTGSGMSRVVTLSGSDDLSGVGQIRYSTDGQHFSVYATPFTAPWGAPVSAFADDQAGNRSREVRPVLPWSLESITFEPTDVSVDFPDSTGTVTLAAPAPAGGVRVMLYTSEPQQAALSARRRPGNGAPSSPIIPEYVDVPAGQTSATFPITGFSDCDVSAYLDCLTYNGIFGRLGKDQTGILNMHTQDVIGLQ